MRLISNLFPILCLVVSETRLQEVNLMPAQRISEGKEGDSCLVRVEVETRDGTAGNPREALCSVDEGGRPGEKKGREAWDDWTVAGWYTAEEYSHFQPVPDPISCRVVVIGSECARFLRGKAVARVRIQGKDASSPLSTTARRLAVYCHPTCATCVDELATGCLSCRADSQLTGTNTCICAAGYYPVPAAASCGSCHPTCATCTDAGNDYCQSCHPNATLLANTCKCNSGYGWNAGFCSLCAATCLTCYKAANASSCKSCAPGQSLASSAPSYCLCAPGFYPISAICASCDSECATCIGPNPNDCFSCFYYASLIGLTPSSCMCWSGYGGLPNSCQRCDVTCVTCSLGNNATACTSCNSPATLDIPGFPSACICPAGTYTHPVTGNCQSCHISCIKCTSDSPNTCTACAPNAYLASGLSPDRCVCQGGSTSPPGCFSCSAMCRLCDGSGCTACFPNAELIGVNCACLSGFYGNAENCLVCNLACLTCSGPSSSECLSCKSRAQLNGSGGCVCMSSFFGIPDSCQPCPSSICLSCSDSNTCLSCVSNAILAVSLCICSSGFFPNPSTETCDGCDPSCQRCDRAGLSGCTQCWDTAALTGVGVGDCTCPSGTYFNSTAKQCSVCSTPQCVSCSGPGVLDCLVCVGYMSAGSCLPCDSGCLNTCVGPGSGDCVTCNSSCAKCVAGLVPSPCVCGPGKYLNLSVCDPCPVSCSKCITAGVCSACPPNSVISGVLCICQKTSESPPNCLNSCHQTCQTCSGPQENQCVSCYSPAIAPSGKCSCPSQYYPDPTVTHCSSCNSTCLECVGPNSSDCTACPSGYALTGTGYKSSCYQLPCNPTCNGCTSLATPNQCAACHINADLVIATSTCLCRVGFYPDGQTFRCVACPNVCISCSLNIICITCYSNNAHVKVEGSQKICRCNTGFYPDPTDRICSPCHLTCLNCSGPLDTDCKSCPANSSPSGTTCNCNTGFYRPGPNLACASCLATCSTCDSSTYPLCTSCKANAQLIGLATCTCTDGYYPSPDASNCPPCPLPCAKCTSSTNCAPCKSNAEFSGSICVCSDGFFPNPPTGSCQSCHIRCLTCLNETFRDCKTCKLHSSPVYLTSVKNRCDCDNNYFYASNDLCTPCHPSCFNCLSDLATDCSECYPKAHLFDSLLPNPCVCVEGLYPMPYTSNCLPCDFTCFHCAGPLASDCLDCLDFAELAGPTSPNSCKCVSNAYPNPDSAHCTLCQQECASCIDNSISRCTKCWPGAFLHHIPPSDCLCNPGAYPSPDASSCEACASVCLTCESAFECLSCRRKAVLVGVECVCEDRYFPDPDAGNCQACGVNCKSCDLAGCVVCDDWYFSYAKECLSACPSDFKSDPNGTYCLSKDFNPPVPSLSVSPSNNLLLSFNTNITSTLTSADLDISVTQPSSLYIEVRWSAPSFVGPDSLQVDLSLQSSALENNSYAVLTFLSPDKIRNLDGAEMTVRTLNADLNSYGVVDGNTTKLAETPIAQQTTTTGQSSAAVAATASLLAGSPTSFLTAVNNNQLLTYIPLSKIPLPQRFAAALTGMNMKAIMSNPVPLSLPWNYSGFQPADAIVDYGINTVLFLPNVIWIFATWALVAAVYGCIYAGSRTGWKVLAVYCRLLLKSLVWEVPLLLYFSSYLDLGVYSCFQLLYSSNLDLRPYVLLNYTCACVAFICFAAVPILLTRWIWLHFGQIAGRKDPQFLERWEMLIAPFEQTGEVPSVAYYVIFLLRRMVLGLTLVIGRDYPVLFGLINTAICVTSLIYTLLWRPFHLKMDQFDAIWAEITITLTYLLASSFLIDLNPYISSLFDEIGVWTVRSVLILGSISSIIRLFLTFYSMLSLYVRARHIIHDSHVVFHRSEGPRRLSFNAKPTIRTVYS